LASRPSENNTPEKCVVNWTMAIKNRKQQTIGLLAKSKRRKYTLAYNFAMTGFQNSFTITLSSKFISKYLPNIQTPECKLMGGGQSEGLNPPRATVDNLLAFVISGCPGGWNNLHAGPTAANPPHGAPAG